MWDPELLLVGPDEGWASYEGDWPERRAALDARSGLVYRVLVIGYGEPQTFQLLADVQP